MTRRLPFFSLAILTLALLCPGAAQAGTTGKVHGYVKDQKGAPLPGANVVLEEIKQGAVTDAKGYYVIINIFPGVYTLTASLIGYNSVSKSPIIVIADQRAPYSTVKSVLASAALNGYTDFKLAVVRGE